MQGIRTIGQLLVVLVAVAGFYRAYKRWRTIRAIRRIASKVVLITGASSGLGEALARVLHSAGAKVILAGRNVQKLKQIKFSLDAKSPGNGKVYKSFEINLLGKCKFFSFKKGNTVRHSPAILELDVTEGHAILDRASSAISLFGHIDILINNAGISSRSSVLETDTRVDRTVMETNYFGPVQLTKAILPSMLEQGFGQIVVISSLQGKIGLPHRSSYAASKHALHGYFDSLRVEVKPRGVSVTLVCLGYVQTRLSVNALRGDGRQHGVTDHNTMLGMPAEKAAYKTLEVIARQERESIIAKPLNHLAIYIKMFLPSLLDWILRKRAKLD